MKKTSYLDFISMRGNKEKLVIDVEPNYGINEIRKNKKIVNLNGIMIYDIHRIEIEITSMVCITLCDESNKQIARCIMSSNQSLIEEIAMYEYLYAIK